MRADSGRWTEVSPSPFPHEREGLHAVRDLLPDRPPFRAWSNFEFCDSHGKWHEVDLLVLGERQLHLVELKYYSGVLRGSSYRWERAGSAQEDSPVLLARRKAQRLASLLRDGLVELTRNARDRPQARDVLPFVQQSVFLHHPRLVCELPDAARADLFGPDDATRTSGLPGISTRLLEPPTGDPLPRTMHDDGRLLLALIQQIGFARRRPREYGSWRLVGAPLADGKGWQDWPAQHKITGEPATIRFFVSPPSTAQSERHDLARRAAREFELTRHLRHDAVMVPVDLVDGDLGPGLVYRRDDAWQRLDLWLTSEAAAATLPDRLQIVRGLAEATGYAHRNHVVHRGLTPAAVLVRRGDDSSVRVQLGGWQVAGRDVASRTPTAAATRLDAILGTTDDDADGAARAAAYQAPEWLSNPDADRVRLDVFALGAVASYVLTGRPPATGRGPLRDRVARDGGIDVAADLPEVGSHVRALVLQATRPAVSDRLADVPAFLAELAHAEREAVPPVEDVDPDPVGAPPGTLLAGRFRLVRQLGRGSTAVGLLVTDEEDGDARRVLKVAHDARAAARLDAEADVLRDLNHPRLARLMADPLDVGGRRALLLDSAGERTLADELRGRPRLSLDLLERWGVDLLEALVALDAAGVDHRDIKPGNLGIRENPGDRVKHLVLFDFSLAQAGASAVEAGTPPYLDPFLGSPRRPRWDSAAERYAAAVTLFEMATGVTPVYGDGSNPQVVAAEATVEPDMFDPAVAEPLTAFFTRALARDVGRRQDTAADLLAEWRRALSSPTTTTVADDADERAAAATLDTRLVDAGLTPRALSALEPLHLVTVADLLAVELGRLTVLPGIALATRQQILARAKAWRDRLRPRPPEPDARLGLTGAAEVLLGTIADERLQRVARLLLGLDDGVSAFATQAELGAALGTGPDDAGRLVAALQGTWAEADRPRRTLDALRAAVEASLGDLGGVATSAEVVADLVTGADEQRRLTEGLLRLALGHADQVERDGGPRAPARRRHRHVRQLVVASAQGLPDVEAAATQALDAADAAGARADALVAAAVTGGEAVVPAARAAAEVRAAWQAVAPSGSDVTDARLVALAAQVSARAVASGRGELHDRDLDVADAVRLTLAGLPTSAGLAPREVADRVRARFPALPPLPERPALDVLLNALGFAFDPQTKVYASLTRRPDTSTLGSRTPTGTAVPGGLSPAAGRIWARLDESVRARSFLALGVRADALDRATHALAAGHDAQVVDVTGVLLDALRAQAEAAGVPWDAVRAADAAEPGTRDAQGLTVLVQRAMPAVEAAVHAAVAAAAGDAGTGGPVLLVEAAPLARYRRLDVLAAWADLGRRRPRAVWVLLPLLRKAAGPMLDDRPLPLASSGQFVWLSSEWVAAGPARPESALLPGGAS